MSVALARLLDSDLWSSFRRSPRAVLGRRRRSVAGGRVRVPAVLIALLMEGVVRGVVSAQMREDLASLVLIASIALSFWPQFARTVRGSTLVERRKEYVQAARVIGLKPRRILRRHVLPNVIGP